MAYATSNPPVALSTPLTRGSSAAQYSTKPNLWLYASTNLTTDLVAANFFTDGFYLGMRQGDIVMGTEFLASSVGSSAITFTGVITSVTTAGAAMQSTNSIMTSTMG